MGGGGGNIPIGSYGGTQGVFDYGNFAGYGQPATDANKSPFSQSQQNYIQAQGKLPTAFGGGALSEAQQNFFNTKGYLPGGMTGDNIGQQFYKPQQQQQQYFNPYQIFSGGGQQSNSPFSQSQQNYIQSQGKLPGAFGGGALSQAQQNFFNQKGYLPGGVQGDKIGQQFYKPQQQQQVPYGNAFGLGGGYPGMQQLAGSNKPRQ